MKYGITKKCPICKQKIGLIKFYRELLKTLTRREDKLWVSKPLQCPSCKVNIVGPAKNPIWQINVWGFLITLILLLIALFFSYPELDAIQILIMLSIAGLIANLLTIVFYYLSYPMQIDNHGEASDNEVAPENGTTSVGNRPSGRIPPDD